MNITITFTTAQYILLCALMFIGGAAIGCAIQMLKNQNHR